jgi:hypothetical protein
MPTSPELQDNVRRQLSSETFEPDELTELLVERGYEEAEVTAAIAEVVNELEGQADNPAKQQQLARRRRAARMLRFGVMVLAIGLAFSVLGGRSILQLLLVIVVGGGLITAGYRGLKQ